MIGKKTLNSLLVGAGLALGGLSADAVAGNLVCESWSQPCQVLLTPNATVTSHTTLRPLPKAVARHSIKPPRPWHEVYRSPRLRRSRLATLRKSR